MFLNIFFRNIVNNVIIIFKKKSRHTVKNEYTYKRK